MGNAVTVAMVGIGGYGDSYLEALLNDPRAREVRLVGAVDPAPHRCKRLDALRDRGCPVVPTLAELFDRTPDVDLVTIASPIHLHAAHTCEALAGGASVLCEKPLAGSVADARRMAEAERAAAGFVAIGYQWSFSRAVQALKRDILAGALGRPVRMRTLVHFPRPTSYFRRNAWAGRLYTRGGDPIFDSPVNNATAHYLHNMFYLLGATRETSAAPLTVQAELYRANDIENYDTAAVRATTDAGADVLFYTSHCVPERVGPVCRFEFERAVVEFDWADGQQFVARFVDGTTRAYGEPEADRREKIWQSVDAVRTGAAPACGIEAAMSQTLCVAAAQRSAQVTPFPDAVRRSLVVDGEPFVGVDGLAEAMAACYARAALPAEIGVAWAREAAVVDVARAVAPATPEAVA